MPFIEVTEEQNKILCDLANQKNLSIGDFLTKIITVIGGSLRIVKYIQEQNQPMENSESKNICITIGGILYQAKTYRKLFINVIEGIGPLKILNVYDGNILKTSLEPEDIPTTYTKYTKIKDGRNYLYLYTNKSKKDILDAINKFCELLNLKVEMEKEDS
jgi:hypothetical protein